MFGFGTAELIALAVIAVILVAGFASRIGRKK